MGVWSGLTEDFAGRQLLKQWLLLLINKNKVCGGSRKAYQMMSDQIWNVPCGNETGTEPSGMCKMFQGRKEVAGFSP